MSSPSVGASLFRSACGVLVVAVLAPGAAAGAASRRSAQAAGAPAQVTGTLTGLGLRGLPSRDIVVVSAISVQSGRVVASVRLTRSLRYTLSLAAGPYVVVADVADLPSHRTYTAQGHLIRLRRGQRVHADMRVHAGAAVRSPTASARTASTIKIVGVSPSLKVNGLLGWDRGLPLDGYVISALTQGPCPPGSDTEVQVVELRHRAELLKEVKLSNSHLADPSSRVTPHFLVNRYLVTGSGTASGGTLSVSLNLVD
jgi:hypothetical protein